MSEELRKRFAMNLRQWAFAKTVWGSHGTEICDIPDQKAVWNSHEMLPYVLP